MKNQEDIFNSIPIVVNELKSLSRYVQNDLEYMIKNNNITLEMLKGHKNMFYEDIQVFLDNYYLLCKDIVYIYDEAINNYNKIQETN